MVIRQDSKQSAKEAEIQNASKASSLLKIVESKTSTGQTKAARTVRFQNDHDDSNAQQFRDDTRAATAEVHRQNARRGTYDIIPSVHDARKHIRSSGSATQSNTVPPPQPLYTSRSDSTLSLPSHSASLNDNTFLSTSANASPRFNTLQHPSGSTSISDITPSSPAIYRSDSTPMLLSRPTSRSENAFLASTPQPSSKYSTLKQPSQSISRSDNTPTTPPLSSSSIESTPILPSHSTSRNDNDFIAPTPQPSPKYITLRQPSQSISRSDNTPPSPLYSSSIESTPILPSDSTGRNDNAFLASTPQPSPKYITLKKLPSPSISRSDNTNRSPPIHTIRSDSTYSLPSPSTSLTDNTIQSSTTPARPEFISVHHPARTTSRTDSIPLSNPILPTGMDITSILPYPSTSRSEEFSLSPSLYTSQSDDDDNDTKVQSFFMSNSERDPNTLKQYPSYSSNENKWHSQSKSRAGHKPLQNFARNGKTTCCDGSARNGKTTCCDGSARNGKTTCCDGSARNGRTTCCNSSRDRNAIHANRENISVHNRNKIETKVTDTSQSGETIQSVLHTDDNLHMIVQDSDLAKMQSSTNVRGVNGGLIGIQTSDVTSGIFQLPQHCKHGCTTQHPPDYKQTTGIKRKKETSSLKEQSLPNKQAKMETAVKTEEGESLKDKQIRKRQKNVKEKSNASQSHVIPPQSTMEGNAPRIPKETLPDKKGSSGKMKAKSAFKKISSVYDIQEKSVSQRKQIPQSKSHTPPMLHSITQQHPGSHNKQSSPMLRKSQTEKQALETRKINTDKEGQQMKQGHGDPKRGTIQVDSTLQQPENAIEKIGEEYKPVKRIPSVRLPGDDHPKTTEPPMKTNLHSLEKTLEDTDNAATNNKQVDEMPIRKSPINVFRDKKDLKTATTPDAMVTNIPKSEKLAHRNIISKFQSCKYGCSKPHRDPSYYKYTTQMKHKTEHQKQKGQELEKNIPKSEHTDYTTENDTIPGENDAHIQKTTTIEQVNVSPIAQLTREENEPDIEKEQPIKEFESHVSNTLQDMNTNEEIEKNTMQIPVEHQKQISSINNTEQLWLKNTAMHIGTEQDANNLLSMLARCKYGCTTPHPTASYYKQLALRTRKMQAQNIKDHAQHKEATNLEEIENKQENTELVSQKQTERTRTSTETEEQILQPTTTQPISMMAGVKPDEEMEQTQEQDLSKSITLTQKLLTSNEKLFDVENAGMKKKDISPQDATRAKRPKLHGQSHLSNSSIISMPPICKYGCTTPHGSTSYYKKLARIQRKEKERLEKEERETKALEQLDNKTKHSISSTDKQIHNHENQKKTSLRKLPVEDKIKENEQLRPEKGMWQTMVTPPSSYTKHASQIKIKSQPQSYNNITKIDQERKRSPQRMAIDEKASRVDTKSNMSLTDDKHSKTSILKMPRYIKSTSDQQIQEKGTPIKSQKSPTNTAVERARHKTLITENTVPKKPGRIPNINLDSRSNLAEQGAQYNTTSALERQEQRLIALDNTLTKIKKSIDRELEIQQQDRKYLRAKLENERNDASWKQYLTDIQRATGHDTSMDVQETDRRDGQTAAMEKQEQTLQTMASNIEKIIANLGKVQEKKPDKMHRNEVHNYTAGTREPRHETSYFHKTDANALVKQEDPQYVQSITPESDGEKRLKAKGNKLEMSTEMAALKQATIECQRTKVTNDVDNYNKRDPTKQANWDVGKINYVYEKDQTELLSTMERQEQSLMELERKVIQMKKTMEKQITNDQRYKKQPQSEVTENSRDSSQNVSKMSINPEVDMYANDYKQPKHRNLLTKFEEGYNGTMLSTRKPSNEHISSVVEARPTKEKIRKKRKARYRQEAMMHEQAQALVRHNGAGESCMVEPSTPEPPTSYSIMCPALFKMVCELGTYCKFQEAQHSASSIDSDAGKGIALSIKTELQASTGAHRKAKQFEGMKELAVSGREHYAPVCDDHRYAKKVDYTSYPSKRVASKGVLNMDAISAESTSDQQVSKSAITRSGNKGQPIPYICDFAVGHDGSCRQCTIS